MSSLAAESAPRFALSADHELILEQVGIADRGMQVHGGSGYIWEMEINRLCGAGRLWQIGAGTNEVRPVIIARELLGL